MTFRARPTSKRPRTWEDRDRRSMLLNVGFGITIVSALLLLLIAAGVSWYGDHLSSSATVNGQSISKDAYQKQLAINTFRNDYENRRIRTLLTAGHLRTADAQARQALIDQETQQASTIALEQLVDGQVMSQLAPAQHVTVSDVDIDAKLKAIATTPELRHAWMIAITPALSTDETTPTDAEKAAAKTAADQALADLKAGKDWATVAKSASTDASKAQGGDLGYIDADAGGLDAAFVKGLFAAPKDSPTAVIEGDDGTFRIGRVTDVVAPVTDATLDQQVTDAGISMSDFRAALGRDVLRTKLSDAIVASAETTGPQREVSEIHLGVDIDPNTGSPSGKESQKGAVKVRHILYAPGGDPSAAASLAPDDPAWKTAQDKAQATYEKLKANPELFGSIVKTDSDDPGSKDAGGTYWFTPDDSLLPEFHDAIFKPGLQPGQLLAPVKTSAGWHVIQIEHFAPDTDWAKQLKQKLDAGTLTFADAARDNSDATSAATGGDMGWVGKGQLDAKLEQAIFAAPVGKVSDPLTIAGDGTYLFLVNQEQTRAPDATQKAAIEASAFSTWYAAQKDAFDITRDASITASASQ